MAESASLERSFFVYEIRCEARREVERDYYESSYGFSMASLYVTEANVSYTLHNSRHANYFWWAGITEKSAIGVLYNASRIDVCQAVVYFLPFLLAETGGVPLHLEVYVKMAGKEHLKTK